MDEVERLRTAMAAAVRRVRGEGAGEDEGRTEEEAEEEQTEEGEDTTDSDGDAQSAVDGKGGGGPAEGVLARTLATIVTPSRLWGRE